MAWVLQWKTTAAMGVSYAALAVILVYFIRDGTTVLFLLFFAFALVLFAGNMYLRVGGRGRGKGFGGRGTGDRDGIRVQGTGDCGRNNAFSDPEARDLPPEGRPPPGDVSLGGR